MSMKIGHVDFYKKQYFPKSLVSENLASKGFLKVYLFLRL